MNGPEAGSAASPSEVKQTESIPVHQKPIIVDWEGPDDPENPKNWPRSRKWLATAITSAFAFISPVSSSMLAPVGDKIADEFGIHSQIVVAMTTSIFVLAYAFGPLLLGPLSEIYGRNRVLQLANCFFLIFNLACGFSRNTTELLIFRFLSGIGGSAPNSIAGAVVADTWRPEERGTAMALYSLAPLVGPIVGPVTGAWIGLRTTWRWVLWSISIADALVQLLGMLFLQETFAPILLERKAVKVRLSMGLRRDDVERVKTPFTDKGRDWRTIFGKALLRPFAIFFKEPIVQVFAAYQSFIYGVLFLSLTTVPQIFLVAYAESTGIAGLHYIGLGLGCFIGAQVTGRVSDWVYGYLKVRNGGVGKPEFRLPTIVPGSIWVPLGLLIFGWTAQNKVFWLAPDIGLLFIGAGFTAVFQSTTTYLIDIYTLHAASALASCVFWRSLAGFGFPLFAPAMFDKLGYGGGSSLLAGASVVLGCPAPFLLWKYGERIRAKSRWVVIKKDGKPQGKGAV